MNLKTAAKLLFIIAVIVFLAYVVLNGLPLGLYEIVPVAKEIKQGLDLKGGLYVIYEAQLDPGEPDKAGKIAGAIKVMRNRLDKESQHEATIARQGDNRIRVEIPGVHNPRELADILAKPAVLEFIDPDGNVVLTGRDIKTAKPGLGGERGSEPVVFFELNPEGAKRFADITTKLYKKERREDKIIKIVLDGNVISAPAVESAIVDGKGEITGMKDIEEAKHLANLIESGALPVPLKQMEIRTIGATLGADALDKAVKAGIIGIAAILLFMLVYYRLPGLVADLALVVYIILNIIIIAAAKVTLTLPGIAGIILSAGMAVDANVIIFERMKEEIRAGKTLRASVESGFKKAFRAILDANVTTLIAAFVLLYFGTGPIQGFAKTLIIGILISMFTAIVFTRYVLKLIMDLNIKNRKLYVA